MGRSTNPSPIPSHRSPAGRSSCVRSGRTTSRPRSHWNGRSGGTLGAGATGADGAGVVAFYADCRRDGGLLHLVIADRVTDAYLGEAMLALSEHGVGEVGCCVVPAARRRGMATEAV